MLKTHHAIWHTKTVNNKRRGRKTEFAVDVKGEQSVHGKHSLKNTSSDNSAKSARLWCFDRD